ncbi:cobalt ECF transporter T component CbiQ [Methanocaldococcus bathoardescens]|uniref:cobalt ECF transporter T component CbiQ n=1 Tax=Methanocaldococcus bathoardescens TaxID=1301915 RepID=UPI00064FC020|nr:cobalt ECF transporter T component CbiQ [Methanocaldococcus bathoardescens]
MQNTIDSIAFNNNLRNINPKLKVIFAILSLFICVASKSVIVPLIITIIMIYLTLFKAKVPKKIYLTLFFPVFGFGLFTLIFMAFWYGTTEMYSFKIFGFTIGFYKEGLDMGLLVFSRMLGGVASTLFLALTTPMTEIFYILRSLGLPSVVVDIAMMMYRYIFVLLDELIRMQNAQETRLGYKDLKTTYKSLGMLASNLFIRTWEKGEQLFITMSSRGYDGELRILGEIENPKLIYMIGIILFEIILVIISYLTMDFKPI